LSPSGSTALSAFLQLEKIAPVKNRTGSAVLRLNIFIIV
jgi:hypothetical protein